MTCIRVIAILTLIRQLCKPKLHESKIKLHEFRANKQTFFGHITKYPLRKLEVFICQITEEIHNPLTIVSYLFIKAAPKTGMLLNYKPPTSPQATSRRPSPTTRRLRRSSTENSRRCSLRMR